MSGVDTKRSFVHATDPITSVEELESTSNVIVSSCSSDPITVTTPELVVTGGKFIEGSKYSGTKFPSSNYNRCESERLGRSHEQSYNARLLVQAAKTSAHQLSGDGGGISDTKTFSLVLVQSECIDPHGQYNSDAIPQQTRGNKVGGTVSINSENMVSSSREQGVSKVSTLCLEEKCIGGHAKQTNNKTNRMDIEPKAGERFVSSLWASTHGLVCKLREQEDSYILLLDSPSESVCDRCIIHSMEQNVCLCVSANTIDSQGVAAYETVSVSDNFDCPSLVTAYLVSKMSRIAGGNTNTSSQVKQPTVSSKGCNTSSKSTKSEIDAWLLYTHVSHQKVFQRELESYWQPHGGREQRRTIIQNSNSSVIGAVNGILIPIKQL